MTRLFSASVVLACLVMSGTQAVAATASPLVLLKSSSSVQDIGYHHRHHRCWWRHGHRHCRWW
jgi:hypothetical protein